MTASMRRALMLAGVGLFGGFALVVAFFGTGELLKRHSPGSATDHTETPLADLPQDREPDARTDAAKPGAPFAGLGTGYRPELDSHGALDPLAKDDAGLGDGLYGTSKRSDASATEGPRLDIVRIEPSGDTVIAGRSAPNSVVEILRDNKPIARIDADASGQFAIVPPALPSGNSELTLRMTDRDGKAVRGRESVEVVVAPDGNTKPLIAISEPDKPTRVLSQPEESAQGMVAAKSTAAGGQPAQAGAGPKAETKPMAALSEPSPASPGADASAPVKIVSVDAQEGGRLHVTGQTTAWASLRLYLNDTMVASGRSDADGRIAFTIGRGVRPGAYQIRVDQVDADTGKVRNRAQVAFAYPPSLADQKSARETLAAPTPKPAPGQHKKGTPTDMAQTPTPPKPEQGAGSTGASETRPIAEGPADRTASAQPSRPHPVPPPSPASGSTEAKVADSANSGTAQRDASGKAGTGAKDTAAKQAPASHEPGKPNPAQRAFPEAPSIAAASGTPEAGRTSTSRADSRAAAALAPSLPEAAGSAPRQDGSATQTRQAREPVVAAAGAGALGSEGKLPDNKEMAVLAPPAGQAGTVFVPEISTAKITRGDNLWQISRRTYGSGLRYTVIYDANQDQIRDPDLIYPGQIFVLPKEGARKPAKSG